MTLFQPSLSGEYTLRPNKPRQVYQGQRVARGVYLQLANNGVTFYAIVRQVDGRDFGLERGPRQFSYWTWDPVPAALHKRLERMSPADVADVLVELRGHYAFDLPGQASFPTKSSAVKAALASGAAR